jgi:hypothetical protein
MLETLIQERNVEIPHVRQQPVMHTTGPSFPISTWVESLRQEVETGPHPRLPDFNPFELEGSLQCIDSVSADDLGALSMGDASYDCSALDPSLQVPLDGTQPLADFQEDAAFLQSAHLGLGSTENISLVPPPITTFPDDDWYLPPPELGTSLLAEYLTDLNTAYPLYQPDVIADHVRTCYAGLPDESAVAWTSTYIAFGMAHQ